MSLWVGCARIWMMLAGVLVWWFAGLPVWRACVWCLACLRARCCGVACVGVGLVGWVVVLVVACGAACVASQCSWYPMLLIMMIMTELSFCFVRFCCWSGGQL